LPAAHSQGLRHRTGIEREELLERVQRDAVDLVLLDIEMPNVSGLDALKALREHYSAAQLPIIMVTWQKHKATTLLRHWS